VIAKPQYSLLGTKYPPSAQLFIDPFKLCETSGDWLLDAAELDTCVSTPATGKIE
jgi:hypothetical protein